MTTTPEVPMPATFPYVERIVRIIRDRVVDDTAAIVLIDFARAYADARCAQESSALLGLIADIRVAAGDPTGKLDWSGLVAHVAKLQAERGALAEKVKAMEDNDRRYRWLRDGGLPAPKDRFPVVTMSSHTDWAIFGDGLDAAIDAAGAANADP